MPIPPASIAAVISPILVIRMRHYPSRFADEPRRTLTVTLGNGSCRGPFPASRVRKREPRSERPHRPKAAPSCAKKSHSLPPLALVTELGAFVCSIQIAGTSYSQYAKRRGRRRGI